MAAVGVMPREIRLVILSLGLVAAGVPASPDRPGRRVGTVRPSRPASRRVALAIITIGATITAIQRILHVRSQAKSADHHHRPQLSGARRTT